jgi:CBS domain-containing protein
MYKLLTSFTVNSPVFPSDGMVVYRVKRTDSAQSALELLIKHGLTAVPIVDEHSSQPIALFSCAAVVAYVVKHLDPHHTASPRAKDWAGFFLADAKFKAMTCFDLVHYVITHYHVPPAVAVESHLTLLGAMKIAIEKQAHDVMVYDKEQHNRLCNVIATSRIVQFLSAAVEDLPAAKQPIGNFEGALAVKKPLVAVLDDAKVLSAFEQMLDKGVTCCAVVGGNGKLSGSISLSDIKTVGADFAYLHLLGDTAANYLVAVSESRMRPDWTHRTPRPKVVTCAKEDSLRDVLSLFSFYKIHHIYIVDADDKPTGIISTTDVVRWVVAELHADKLEEAKADKEKADAAAHHHHHHHHDKK